MTDLRDHMHDTVDHQHTDLVALTSRARQQGTTLRRRHRFAVAGSALAVVAVLGAGAVAAAVLLPDASVVSPGRPPWPTRGGTSRSRRSQSRPTAPRPRRPRVAPRPPRCTPRSPTSCPAPAPPSRARVRSSLHPTPTASSPSHPATAPERVRSASTCRTSRSSLTRSPDSASCASTGWRPAGSPRSRTARCCGRTPSTARPSAVARASAWSPSVWWARSGSWPRPPTASSFPPTTGTSPGQDAVLSTEQLTAVVSQPWWGFELPVEFSGARDVPSYTEYSTSVT